MTSAVSSEPAASHVQSALETVCSLLPEARAFSEEVRRGCALRLEDIVDTLIITGGIDHFLSSGWREVRPGLLRHSQMRIPDVARGAKLGVVIRADDIEQLLDALGVEAPIEGPPHAPVRRARIFSSPSAVLDAVERGGEDVATTSFGPRKIRRAQLHQQIFRTRRRQFRSRDLGFAHAERLVDAAIADLGAAWAGDLFLRAEREYWERQCYPGAFVGRRLSQLGVGWANIDHIAYRTSREHFHRLIGVFGKLGFAAVELAQPSPDTGWGACRLESASLRRAIVIEVDLNADECSLESFPRNPPPLRWHTPVGLWAALHGESILDGGIARVGALFDPSIHELLVTAGLKVTANACGGAALDFPRAININRIDSLERGGYLSAAVAERFRLNGDIASTLMYIGGAAEDFGVSQEVPALIEYRQQDGVTGALAPTRRQRVRFSRSPSRSKPRVSAP